MATGFLTVEETAALLRCCPDTVRAGIHRGEIQATRVGRVIRIPASQFGPAEGAPGTDAA